MTMQIDPHGKGHQILAYLDFAPAELEDILHAVAPMFRNDRAKVSHRLRRLCKLRLVCWVDRIPPLHRPLSPEWWANCQAEFRLTRLGRQALEMVEPVTSVRVFERAA